jgi:RND family efflux transporter MFP subunit
MKRFATPLIIVALTVAVITALLITRPRLEPVETPERAWPVQVVTAAHSDVQPTLELFGEIVAGRRSELRPQVAGLVVEIGPNMHEGGAVERGELLLRIDAFDYETGLAEQRALLREAEARLAKLRRDLERARNLFAEANVSEQFLDDAELAVAEQESLLEQRRIGVRRAERDLADSRLLAPFDGVLANVNADLGKQLSEVGSEMVAELIDTSRLEVRFNLSNAQYGRLLDSGEPLLGRPVEVIWKVGGDDIRYAAVIARLGAQIAAVTGGVEMFATIDSGGRQTQLRPGAFVSVHVADRLYREVLALPETALYGEDTVYVVDDARMTARPVKVVGYSGDEIFVASNGEPAILDGDTIVVTQLREGGTGVKVMPR